MTDILENKILIYYNKNNNKILQMEFIKFLYGFNKEESLALFNQVNNIKDFSTELTILDKKEYDCYFNLCSQTQLIPIIEYDAEKNILKFDYNLDHSYHFAESCYWNQHNPQRHYSFEQVLNLYHDNYLNFNLKNILTSDNNLYVKFLSLDQLILCEETLSKDWNGCFLDPFLDEYSEDKTELGKSILEKGTYFPCQVFLNYDYETYIVREGNHRIASLKLCQLQGLVPDDFKICCIVLPRDFFTTKVMNNYKIAHAFEAQYILECYWGRNVINDKEYNNIVKEELKKNNHLLLNDYLVQQKITTFKELFGALNLFPLFLRDLFYLYKNIKPAEIINNEELFFKWLNE